jgi:hypothetical protein
MGLDEPGKFPQYKYSYELKVRGQDDAIDLHRLGKKRQDKELAIYYASGDYLMICIGWDSRPKSFTSTEDNKNWIHILRRRKPN